MSDLVSCRTCGHQVARTAHACPGCGAPDPGSWQAGRGVRRLILAGLALFFGLALLAGPHSTAPQKNKPGVRDGASQRWHPTTEQVREARLALCQAVSEELTEPRGTVDTDPMRLAIRATSAGAAAGPRAVSYEYERSYINGKWTEADCISLSTAPWAESLYMGDPIHLQRGAIGATIGHR